MKRLVIVFEDDEFERFKNCKESAKKLGEAESWEDYLLKLAKVRK
ncbi:hypothetical protein LCGC14_3010590 [marine sediment metagenome]|uniref:Uncharacterized protein n=1 Tax=marine sediment metagenome TaxID=412755 RepID=A0A0F8WY71_9ZZZZ